MENSRAKSLVSRNRRTMRVRSKVRGSAVKPRMCVVKTNRHIEVQLIDDENGATLAHMTTNSRELSSMNLKRNKEAAKVLGTKIGEKAKAIGVETVVFDRGPFKYHGILAELADAARAQGLQF